MIRGHIEAVSRERVSGWVHANAHPLRDAAILAFHGHQCIGAGRVDRFRPDLLEAGMGDGFVGFDIPIAGERVDQLASVIVRLEGSDACLLQSDAAVVAQAQGAAHMSAEEIEAELASYRWMLAQGWIDQPDSDFLRAITVAGAYDYAVPRAARAAGRTTVAVHEAALHRLCMLNRQQVRLEPRTLTGLDALLMELDAVTAAPLARPVAVLCGGAFKLSVVEAGHAAGTLGDEPPVRRHALQPYQALFLDGRTPVRELELVDCTQITLLRAEPTAHV